MKDLIIGQAYRYDFEQLAPFVTSLERCGFGGETILFVNAVSAETRTQLTSRGIGIREFSYRGNSVRNTAYVAWPYVRWLRHLPVPLALKKAILRPILNIPWVRLILYYDFLVKSPGQYRNVFLTDVRDVIFQGDPFEQIAAPGVRAFLEDESMRIGTSQANIRWITDMFGEEGLRPLADKAISCSGTIIGDYASIVNYLRTFIETAFTVRSTYLNGGDQGIHNYMIYHGLLPAVTLLKNGTAEILTLGYFRPDEGFPTDADGRLVDDDGRVFSVLHQYDRHPALATTLLARFGLKPVAKSTANLPAPTEPQAANSAE